MVKIMEELGYCGCDCEMCEIYRATVFGEVLPAAVLKRWQEDIRKYHGVESVEPEQLKCHGCRYEGKDDFFVFKRCPIRGCCKKHELSSCGVCPDLRTCPWDEPKKNFENIAASE